MKQNSSARVRAVFAVTIGNIIWGTTFLFTKMALNAAGDVLGEQSGTTLVLAVRFMVSMLSMIAVFAFRHPKKSTARKPAKAYVSLVIVSVLSMLYYFFETAALENTTSCLTGAVLAVVPVFAVFPSWLLLRERPTRPQLLTALIPIVGVIAMTVSGGKMGILTTTGLLMIMATCVVSAFLKTFNCLSGKDFSAVERTFAGCIPKAVVYTPLALAQYDFHTQILPLLTNLHFMLPILVLAIVSSIIADTCVSYAASRMSVMECASYGAICTLCSSVAGFFVLNEPMSIWSWIGAALITGGVWLLTKQFGKVRTD